MSTSIKTASAAVTITSAARPDVHIGPQRLTCHLTRGFLPASIDGVMAYAFDAVGQVDLAMGPKDNLSGWEFGFIQIARANDVSFYYAGKTRGQGSIVIHAHRPPALPEALILDTETAFSPWSRRTPRYTYKAPSVTCTTGDHPAVRAGRALENRKTKMPNYLYHIVTDLEFWTVFSAHDELGKFQHLRHFHWRVRYDEKLAWSAGQPRRTRPLSRVTIGDVVNGVPADQGARHLLANPASYRSFNSMVREAIDRSILTAPETNRDDLPERFLTMPGDFWTD